ARDGSGTPALPRGRGRPHRRRRRARPALLRPRDLGGVGRRDEPLRSGRRPVESPGGVRRPRPDAIPQPLVLRERSMPRKEIITVNLAAANPNLSAATKFGNLVFVAGQTGRHPVTGELGKDIREQTRNVIERIKTVLTAAGTSLDNV